MNDLRTLNSRLLHSTLVTDSEDLGDVLTEVRLGLSELAASVSGAAATEQLRGSEN